MRGHARSPRSSSPAWSASTTAPSTASLRQHTARQRPRGGLRGTRARRGARDLPRPRPACGVRTVASHSWPAASRGSPAQVRVLGRGDRAPLPGPPAADVVSFGSPIGRVGPPELTSRRARVPTVVSRVGGSGAADAGRAACPRGRPAGPRRRTGWAVVGARQHGVGRVLLLGRPRRARRAGRRSRRRRRSCRRRRSARRAGAAAPGRRARPGRRPMRRVDRQDHRVGLRRQRQVDHRLGQVDPPLRHPDQRHRLGGGDGRQQRRRVGQPDVLARRGSPAAGR